MDLVGLIDQDTAVLVCSSEPVFEFVLGGDPDRLARVTGKLESHPGLEVQLALGATASFSLPWPTDFLQPVFNQRLRLLQMTRSSRVTVHVGWKDCWSYAVPGQ